MSIRAAGLAMLVMSTLASCTPGVSPSSEGPSAHGEAPSVSTFVDIGPTPDVAFPARLYIDGNGCIRGVFEGEGDEHSPKGDLPVVFPAGTTATRKDVTLPNGETLRFGEDHSSGGLLLPLATYREKTGAVVEPGCTADGDFWFLNGKGP